MKYALVQRQDELSSKITEQFYDVASKYNLTEDKDSPELIISIGGDGTLLEAFHANKSRLDQVAFLGIHTGHLGFYADWHPNELETLVSLIANTPMKTIEYPLVKVKIFTRNDTVELLALNEFTIKNIKKTLVMKIRINDEDFEMFRGDGLCISSPSGSTGYNKSLGGTIIHPALESIQVSEMASINNRVYRTIGSSLLLPKHHFIELFPKNNSEINLTLDQISLQMRDIKSIECSVANETIRFARYRSFPFWNRVRDAFIGSKHME